MNEYLLILRLPRISDKYPNKGKNTITINTQKSCNVKIALSEKIPLSF